MSGGNWGIIKINDSRSHQSLGIRILPYFGSMWKTEWNKPRFKAIENIGPAMSYNKESLCFLV